MEKNFHTEPIVSTVAIYSGTGLHLGLQVNAADKTEIQQLGPRGQLGKNNMTIVHSELCPVWPGVTNVHVNNQGQKTIACPF